MCVRVCVYVQISAVVLAPLDCIWLRYRILIVLAEGIPIGGQDLKHETDGTPGLYVLICKCFQLLHTYAA